MFLLRWSLCILPFTAILTLILTLIICIHTPNHAKTYRLPQISELGTGDAYEVFAAGFCILLPQLLVIIVGRLQFLIHSQHDIPVWLLILIHLIPLVSGIFMLIMAIVSIEQNLSVHLTGAFGMFALVSFYLVFHTILILYLWIQRSSIPAHENIFYLLYFIVCTCLLIICFTIWAVTFNAIAEYLAASAPFLYFIGFVPQFWTFHRPNDETS